MFEKFQKCSIVIAAFPALYWTAPPRPHHHPITDEAGAAGQGHGGGR